MNRNEITICYRALIRATTIIHVILMLLIAKTKIAKWLKVITVIKEIERKIVIDIKYGQQSIQDTVKITINNELNDILMCSILEQ